MLRTVSAVEQRPRLLLAFVFFATWFFRFIVPAARAVYVNWRGHPFVSEFRRAPTYSSAVVGDVLVIPLANVFMTSQLFAWRRKARIAEIVGAVLGAGVLTLAVH